MGIGNPDRVMDGFLLKLYRGSSEIPGSQFQDWSLNLFGGLVRFDAAWWGKTNANPGKILNVHLMHADPSIVSDYSRVSSVDFFRDAMLARPGTTINLSDLMTREDFERSPLYRRYARKHKIESAVGTVLIEPVSSMADFITFWRFDARWPFSETDRQLVERATSHLIEANRISRLVSLQGAHPSAQPTDPIQPWALADAVDGCLLEVSGTFVELAKREWPVWKSSTLPTELRRKLESAESYKGQKIVIEISDVDGYRLLVARPCQLIDRLGNREAEVVQRYACGESYRSIADHLGTSPATVRNQLARVYRKLGVHNKIELVRALDQIERSA